MTTRGAWVDPVLRVLGLVAVAAAVIAGGWWAVLAAGGGVLLAGGLASRLIRRSGLGASPAVTPLDSTQALDLLRRAHGGLAAWAVGLADGPLEAAAPGGPPTVARERGAALVQLASVDGRSHVVRDDTGTYVAVGDFPYGAGVLLTPPERRPSAIDEAVVELRRWIAGARLSDERALDAPATQITRRLALDAGGAQHLDGIAKAGAQLAEQVLLRAAAVVVRDPATGATQVRGVSEAADKRLLGRTLSAEAPVGRAITQGLPIASHGAEDVFGPGAPERRRHERAGTAYPLLDGRLPVGALVVLGPPVDPMSAAGEQLGRLVAELAPRLAAARAVHEAEQRAVRDALTGLCNRGEFERVMERYRDHAVRGEPATLIYADLDHFKRLNDTLGHDAGDAALRHVAGVLEAQIRDGDLVARIGGEEFAVWLPRTGPAAGLEVAERIRDAVAGTAWPWRGAGHRLTVSCGVASFPDPIRDLSNLRPTADAALYRAKQAGRNRVENALRSG